FALPQSLRYLPNHRHRRALGNDSFFQEQERREGLAVDAEGFEDLADVFEDDPGAIEAVVGEIELCQVETDDGGLGELLDTFEGGDHVLEGTGGYEIAVLFGEELGAEPVELQAVVRCSPAFMAGGGLV